MLIGEEICLELVMGNARDPGLEWGPPMKLTTVMLLSLMTHGHMLTIDEHSKTPGWDETRADFDKPPFHRSGYHFGPGRDYPSSSRTTRVVQ
jgi:hypothetical protein